MHCSSYIKHYQIDAELFDYFEGYTGATKDFDTRAKQFIFKLCHAKPNEIVLDIGTGSGWIAVRLAHQGVFITSLDLSHKNLARIKQGVNMGDVEKTSFVLGDALRLPFQDNSFDAIVASEVLEHLNVPSDAVREMYRVLKPNGRVIASTPYNEKIRYYLCIHCNKKTPANAHLHSFDKGKLEDLFTSHNFSNIKFYMYGNKLFIFSRLSQLLRFLPFPLWRLIDNLFNFIIRKPAHIAMIVRK